MCCTSHVTLFGIKPFSSSSWSLFSSRFNNGFVGQHWDPLYLAKDVNVAVSYFNETVKSIFYKYAPNMVKKVRGKPCP